MMAVRKFTAKAGMRTHAAGRRHAAAFIALARFGAMFAAFTVSAVWAGSAVAQISAPITGTMGSASAAADANARTVAPPAQSAQSAQSAQVAGDVAAGAAQPRVVQASQAGQQAAPAARVPANVVRRTTPLRVGEHASDGMLGDETEALLALQASNLAAGPGLPMLGATASRAYKRYLDSFTYAIPQFYPTMVQTESGVGNNSGSGGAAPAAAGAGASQ